MSVIDWVRARLWDRRARRAAEKAHDWIEERRQADAVALDMKLRPLQGDDEEIMPNGLTRAEQVQRQVATGRRDSLEAQRKVWEAAQAELDQKTLRGQTITVTISVPPGSNVSVTKS